MLCCDCKYLKLGQIAFTRIMLIVMGCCFCISHLIVPTCGAREYKPQPTWRMCNSVSAGYGLGLPRVLRLRAEGQRGTWIGRLPIVRSSAAEAGFGRHAFYAGHGDREGGAKAGAKGPFRQAYSMAPGTPEYNANYDELLRQELSARTPCLSPSSTSRRARRMHGGFP